MAYWNTFGGGFNPYFNTPSTGYGYGHNGFGGWTPNNFGWPFDASIGFGGGYGAPWWSNGYGSFNPAWLGGYGYGHPTSIGGNGYGSFNPAWLGGYGYGHPASIGGNGYGNFVPGFAGHGYSTGYNGGFNGTGYGFPWNTCFGLPTGNPSYGYGANGFGFPIWNTGYGLPTWNGVVGNGYFPNGVNTFGGDWRTNGVTPEWRGGVGYPQNGTLVGPVEPRR